MENEPLLPSGTPSSKAQSWGAFISIIVIVLMIVIGAFYSWEKRTAETNVFAPTTTQ
jgi:NADH:ubiquinone oxidoreductase subunit 3 (subunit A)